MWNQIKFVLKGLWKYAKVGLIIGVIIGYIDAKLRAHDFSMTMMSYAQSGALLGAVIGTAVRVKKLLWYLAQKKKAGNTEPTA